MRVRGRASLLLAFAQEIIDAYECLPDCEEQGGTLGYINGRACADCDCLRCAAQRAKTHYRHTPARKARP